MLTLRNPRWIYKYSFPYYYFENIPQEVFDNINQNLVQRTSKKPLVSIVIPAWNEEVNILRSIASLSMLDTQIPFEIIVVNNNSLDKTSLTLGKLLVRNYFEEKQGSGPARQTGQEHALGKYVLLADADCLYPPKWLDEMVFALEKPGIVLVYGRYAFISEPGFPRWKLAFHETLRNIIADIRNFKRPFLNSGGASLGYIKEFGLKVGFIKTRFRGEDGVFTYDMMKYGKVKMVKSSKAIVWTSPRALQRDGTFFQAFMMRIKREFKNFGQYFHARMKYHEPRE
jgi:glycosyltransferase involved in cell wall biosynthesis